MQYSLILFYMLFICHSYLIHMYSYVTCMSSVCHSHVISMSLVCHPYFTGMYSYVIRMSLVYTRMPSVSHSYVLVCHPYATYLYSYVIRMSLVCTCMSSVCHLSVVVFTMSCLKICSMDNIKKNSHLILSPQKNL